MHCRTDRPRSVGRGADEMSREHHAWTATPEISSGPRRIGAPPLLRAMLGSTDRDARGAAVPPKS